MTWKSNKQTVIFRLSVESKYRAMPDLTCELVWIQDIMTGMGFVPKTPMRLYCDNMSAIYIVKKYVFHERTKHIEVYCHVVRESMMLVLLSQSMCLLPISWRIC